MLWTRLLCILCCCARRHWRLHFAPAEGTALISRAHTPIIAQSLSSHTQLFRMPSAMAVDPW